MAALDIRNERYNIIFRYGGKRFTRSLGTRVKKEAEELKERVVYWFSLTLSFDELG